MWLTKLDMANKKTENNDLTKSMEDFLEAVLLLGLAGEDVRVKDVAAMLEVSKPNVVTSTKLLVDRGYIEHEHYGFLNLTESGRAAAEDVYARHTLMQDFLSRVLKVEDDTASRDACELEPCLSRETQERLGKFIEFMDVIFKRHGRVPWMDSFDGYVRTGEVRTCFEAGYPEDGVGE